jgi:hypothetical protein
MERRLVFYSGRFFLFKKENFSAIKTHLEIFARSFTKIMQRLLNFIIEPADC